MQQSLIRKQMPIAETVHRYLVQHSINYGVETFLDQSIMSLASVYFEAGDHKELVHVGGEDFQSLLSGVRHGYFSHDD